VIIIPSQLVFFNTLTNYSVKSGCHGQTGSDKSSTGIEINNAEKLSEEFMGYTAYLGGIYGDHGVIKSLCRNEAAHSYRHHYLKKRWLISVQDPADRMKSMRPPVEGAKRSILKLKCLMACLSHICTNITQRGLAKKSPHYFTAGALLGTIKDN